jgi:hypothetical protein
MSGVVFHPLAILSKQMDIDRYEHLPLKGASVNRVFVHLDNEPEPTGQRAIVSRLLSPFENRHFIN